MGFQSFSRSGPGPGALSAVYLFGNLWMIKGCWPTPLNEADVDMRAYAFVALCHLPSVISSTSLSGQWAPSQANSMFFLLEQHMLSDMIAEVIEIALDHGSLQVEQSGNSKLLTARENVHQNCHGGLQREFPRAQERMMTQPRDAFLTSVAPALVDYVPTVFLDASSTQRTFLESGKKDQCSWFFEVELDQMSLVSTECPHTNE